MTQPTPLIKQSIAECIGTFMLVFAGTGAIIIHDVTGGTVTHIGIGMTFGLVVMSVIYAIGDISGAHINPAVTLGFWISKRFPTKKVIPYISSQILVACLASGTFKLLFPSHPTLGNTLPQTTLSTVFTLELILTAMLMFVILTVSTGAKEKGIMAGIAIGGIVGMEALFAGPLTGASMNPARSIAPALFSGDLSSTWLYISAPFLGAAIAVGLYRLIRTN